MTEANWPESDETFQDLHDRLMASLVRRHDYDTERISKMSPFERAALYYAKRIRSAMVDEYNFQHKRITSGRIGQLLLLRKKQIGVEFGVLAEADEPVLATLQTPIVGLSASEGVTPQLFAVQLRADTNYTESFITERQMNFPWFDFSRSSLFVVDQTPDDAGKIDENNVSYDVSPESSNIGDMTKVNVGPDLDFWPTDESARHLVAILRGVENLFHIKH